MSEIPLRNETTEQEKYKGNQTWQEAYQNPEEIYTAKEIFDLIQNNELRKFNAEKIKTELLEKGQIQEDIDLAMKLMACMAMIDKVAFKKSDIEFKFIHSESEQNNDFFAAYSSDDKNPKERYYQVYVKNLQRKISEQLAHEKIKLIGDDGKLIRNASIISIEEFLLGVAMHEVRHRLQKQENFKMFSIEDTPNLKGHLKEIAIWAKLLLESMKEIEMEGQNRESVIKYYEKQDEFDSRVIEFLTHNKIHSGITLQEFFDLVKIQPE